MQLPPQQVHSYTLLQSAFPRPGRQLRRSDVALESQLQADDLILTCGAAASVSPWRSFIVSPGEEVIVIAPYFPGTAWIDHAQATVLRFG